MPFLIETWDKPGTQSLRAKTRPAHLEYLKSHCHLLLACGAKLDNGVATGGIYIVDTDDAGTAHELIKNDPFFQADLFENVIITNWRKAVFDGHYFLTE